MNNRELERIRIVTRHFAELKGLEKTVPWGLLISGQALGFLLSDLHLGRLGLVIVSPLWLGAALLWRLAPRFYRVKFGEVESPHTVSASMAVTALDRPRYFGGIEVPGYRRPRGAMHRSSDLSSDLFLWWYGTFLISFGAFGSSGPVLGARLLLLWQASLLLWRWVRLQMQSGQLYYPVISSVLLVLAAAGASAAGALSIRDPWTAWNEEMFLAAVVWILVGLFDHRTLARSLAPGAAKELAGDVAFPREEAR